MRPFPPLFLACTLLLVPGARAQGPEQPAARAQAQAQAPTIGTVPDELPPSKPASLQLEMPPGGKSREYQVDEVSVAISRTLDGRGDARGDVSITVGNLRPLDTALLQWARQGEITPDASRRVVITVPPASGTGSGTRYELDGTRVTGFTASHSSGGATTQVMLQLSARRITLDGVVMN